MKTFQAAMGALIDGIKRFYAAKGIAVSAPDGDVEDDD
jgi:hypothetical protein